MLEMVRFSVESGPSITFDGKCIILWHSQSETANTKNGAHANLMIFENSLVAIVCQSFIWIHFLPIFASLPLSNAVCVFVRAHFFLSWVCLFWMHVPVPVILCFITDKILHLTLTNNMVQYDAGATGFVWTTLNIWTSSICMIVVYLELLLLLLCCYFVCMNRIDHEIEPAKMESSKIYWKWQTQHKDIIIYYFYTNSIMAETNECLMCIQTVTTTQSQTEKNTYIFTKNINSQNVSGILNHCNHRPFHSFSLHSYHFNSNFLKWWIYYFTKTTE